MGNCLVIKVRKEIKIMSVDGSEVLKMPSSTSSLKVQESLPDVLPVKAPAAVVDPGAAVRVKLVISKQELKKMLDKEGMSLDDMVSLMRKEQAKDDREQECCGGWRPALESIPEGRDL
ncbi:hypothetical protein SETIT_1G028900v2 [Setaria italica]|uniref:Uncharacterized protein n=1 Tax=Setaria italica TaxID=4555 RepID=K3YWU3_SETIT|nr:uncharacterized protein LOC101779099 [Setaria italica]RCV04782.1 hypothetical protein SETIT_1G028900v2 [Setaria italica]